MVTVVVYIAAPGLTETKWVESSLSVATGRWTEQKPRLTQSVLGSLQVPLIQIARWFNISFQLLYLILSLVWKWIIRPPVLIPYFSGFPQGGGWRAWLLSAVRGGQGAKQHRGRGSELLQGRQGSLHWRTCSCHDSGLLSSPQLDDWSLWLFLGLWCSMGDPGSFWKKECFWRDWWACWGKGCSHFLFCLPCLCFLFKV